MDTYMIADLTVKGGKLPEFNALMGKVFPVLERDYGWKLISGYATLVGDINRVIDVWQVPSANSVADAMSTAAASNPELAGWLGEISELIEGEHLSIATKTSYSP